MAKAELDVTKLVEETFKKHFGVTLDRLRELAEADKDGRCIVLPCKVETLMERYNALKFPTGDEAETYSTGYRNGHKNGQAELLEYLLVIDTGERNEAAEAALKAGDTP